MQQGIIDRLGKTREQINSFRERTIEDLTQRADETLAEARERLKAGRAALDEGREKLVSRADEARKEGQGALLNMQATVLESTRDALAWASAQLGPKAEFVQRGERALTEARLNGNVTRYEALAALAQVEYAIGGVEQQP